MLECTHPPNTSFEEIMVTAARVRGERSESGHSNPPISLPPSTPPRVRHKLRELALALNSLASDEEVVPGVPTESPAAEKLPPTAQAPSSPNETASSAVEENLEAQGALLPSLLENSDEDSGRFPHVARNSQTGFGHIRAVELPRKPFQPPSNQEAPARAPRPKSKPPSKRRSGTPAPDARLTGSADLERLGDRGAD